MASFSLRKLIQKFNNSSECNDCIQEQYTFDEMHHFIEELQEMLLNFDDSNTSDIYIALREPDISNCLLVFLTNVYSCCRVPELKGRKDCGFTERDFVGRASRASQYFQILSIFNKIIVKAQSNNIFDETFLIEFLSVSVLLSAEHAEKTLWSNNQSVNESKNLLREILKTTTKTSVEELLFSPVIIQSNSLRSNIFDDIYKRLKSKLQKQIWKESPSLPLLFKWLLLHTRSPEMGDHLDKLLPPALLFIDDFQIDNRTTGVICLHHIMLHCTHAELMRYGKAEVIFEALHRQMSTHDADFLEIVLPSVLSILKILEPSRKQYKQESKWDDILQQILTDMQIEDKLAVRRLYAKHLKAFIEEMGTKAAYHLKDLMKVLCTYVEVYDNPQQEARLYALDVLLVVIYNLWPRMHSYCEYLLITMMKLMVEVCDERSLTSPSGRSDVLQKCQICLVALNKCCTETVQSYIAQFHCIDLRDEVKDTLQILYAEGS